MLKLAGIGPMLGRYKRANAGPIQASTSTFIIVCPVYWLSTVCTVAGTNGTRQYNASIGPILVCLLGYIRPGVFSDFAVLTIMNG